MQTHDPGADLGNIGLGNLEHVAVDAVKAICHVTGQLYMLLLVLAHGHIVRTVEQNVRCHQAGIGKQTAIDIFSIFRAFILKLRHS